MKPRLRMALALLAHCVAIALMTCASIAATVLVEAERFSQPGGWVVDPQFMDSMGSPYLPELQTLMRQGVGKQPGAHPHYENQGEPPIKSPLSPGNLN